MEGGVMEFDLGCVLEMAWFEIKKILKAMISIF